jgi:hypothetical protein
MWDKHCMIMGSRPLHRLESWVWGGAYCHSLNCYWWNWTPHQIWLLVYQSAIYRHIIISHPRFSHRIISQQNTLKLSDCSLNSIYWTWWNVVSVIDQSNKGQILCFLETDK